MDKQKPIGTLLFETNMNKFWIVVKNHENGTCDLYCQKDQNTVCNVDITLHFLETIHEPEEQQ